MISNSATTRQFIGGKIMCKTCSYVTHVSRQILSRRVVRNVSLYHACCTKHVRAETCDEAPKGNSHQYEFSEVHFDRSVAPIKAFSSVLRPPCLPVPLTRFQRDVLGEFLGGGLRRTNAHSPRDDRSCANCGGKVGRAAWRRAGETTGDSLPGDAKGRKPTALVGLFKGNDRRRWIGRFYMWLVLRA